jgi:beta-alanine--pyruvate transaminase
VIDIRNIGLMGAVELAAACRVPPGARAFDAHVKGFFEDGILLRITGDTIALSPPLIVSKSEIDQIVERIGRIIAKLY